MKLFTARIAGINPSAQLPVGKSYRIESVSFTVETDANLATREISVLIYSQLQRVFQTRTLTLPASTTCNYSFAIGLDHADETSSLGRASSPLADVVIDDSSVVQVIGDNGQAGDRVTDFLIIAKVV